MFILVFDLFFSIYKSWDIMLELRLASFFFSYFPRDLYRYRNVLRHCYSFLPGYGPRAIYQCDAARWNYAPEVAMAELLIFIIYINRSAALLGLDGMGRVEGREEGRGKEREGVRNCNSCLFLSDKKNTYTREMIPTHRLPQINIQYIYTSRRGTCSEDIHVMSCWEG